MVKAVRHDTSSAVVTTGWETVKGGFVGWLTTAVIGAVIVGGLAALAVGTGGAILGGLGLIGGAAATATTAAVAPTALGGIAAALTSGFGLFSMGASALVGGVATASTYGTAGAVIGGALGLLKGGSRVSHESQTFREKIAARSHAAGARLEHAHQLGAQQGYMMGMQDGQQMVVNKLREMQYAMIQEQMAQAQGAHCGTPKCSHVETEMKRRETAAATGQQIG